MGFEIINKLKKEKGLTNAQIAKMSGVTLSTLDKITSGVNTNPKLETLQSICRVLGCRLDDFDDLPVVNAQEIYSSEESEIIKKYRALDGHGKRIVGMVLDEEYSRIQQSDLCLLESAARGQGKQEIVDKHANELARDLSQLPDTDEDI